MANGQYVGVNGVARKVTSPYIGVEGVARNVKSGYVGVNGVARLFFEPAPAGPTILEVKKITSNTYANSTTYENEEFILLNIYPKTGGTVNVTYGGLTKTITDTSGAEEPNAQKVFFGTFNGVTDSVATPTSGELTVDGEYYGVAVGTFAKSDKSSNNYCGCVTGIIDFGNIKNIPFGAFAECTELNSVTIPSTVKKIGATAVLSTGAFSQCTNLKSVIISEGVQSIGNCTFYGCTGLTDVTIPSTVNYIFKNVFAGTNSNNFVTVDSKNKSYKIDGNCLIDIKTDAVISGFLNSVIPFGVKIIDTEAFRDCKGLTSVTIPESVTQIYDAAFYSCKGLTSVTIPESVTYIGASAFDACDVLTSVTFDNPIGWYVTETFNGDASTGTAVDVSDPVNNVTLFDKTYSGHYWYRS